MENLRIKVLSLIVTGITVTCFSSALAQTSSTSSSTDDINKVEISFPVQKDDFLLFYGVTNDPVVDAKLTNLRSDFATKFEDLKDEYKESFDNIVEGEKLVPSIPEEDDDNSDNYSAKVETTATSEKVSTASKATLKIDTSSTIKEKANNTIKKYIIEDTKSVITPIINVVNDKLTIKTEASSWFQKIKSWFGW